MDMMAGAGSHRYDRLSIPRANWHAKIFFFQYSGLRIRD